MKVFSIIFSCLILLCCCTRKGAQLPSNKGVENQEQMDMMAYNKMCIEAENKEIQTYLDTCKTEFIKDSSGFWYKIVNQGNGVKSGSVISISGTVQVLGGEPCYEFNILTLRIGKRDHTKVLDLALGNTNVGDEIWIVSPSSLAYGIKGITDCITSRTPILYKIKIIK